VLFYAAAMINDDFAAEFADAKVAAKQADAIMPRPLFRQARFTRCHAYAYRR